MIFLERKISKEGERRAVGESTEGQPDGICLIGSAWQGQGVWDSRGAAPAGARCAGGPSPPCSPGAVAGALRGPQHRAEALIRHCSDWAVKAPWLSVPWLTGCGRRRPAGLSRKLPLQAHSDLRAAGGLARIWAAVWTETLSPNTELSCF